MIAYELVQTVDGSKPGAAVHVRAIARRGAQHAPLCGTHRDVRPVAQDVFVSLWAQVTCRVCKRELQRVGGAR